MMRSRLSTWFLIWAACLLLGALVWAPGRLALAGADAPPGAERFPAPPHKLLIVGDESYPPFEFLDQDGQPQGMFVDFWRLWSVKTGQPIEYRLMTWAEALRAVEEGRADVLGGVFDSPERRRKLLFTPAYFQIPVHVFFHRSIYGLKGLSDLHGFRVGVVKEDYAESWLAARAPSLQLIRFPSFEHMIKAAADSRVKVFVADQPVALFHLARLGLTGLFKEMQSPLYLAPVHSAVPVAHPELLDLLQGGLASLDPAARTRVEEQWKGRQWEGQVPWTWISLTLAAVGLVLILVMIWNYTLRRKVNRTVAGLSAREAQLRESEEKYRLLVDHQTDLIIRADLDGRLQFVSPSYCRAFGLSQDQALDQPFEPLVSLTHGEPESAGRGGLAEPPYSVHLERPAQTVDGARWLAWVLTAMRSPAGEVTGYLGVGRNVQLRREAEEELSKAHALLRALLDSIPDIIFVKDAQGVYQLANRAFAEMMGRRGEDILGLTDYELFPPEQAAEFRHQDRAAWGAGRPLLTEERLTRADGVQIVVETVKTTYRGPDGETLGLLGISRDLTERLHGQEEQARLEARLHHAQKMEAVGTLVSGIAHDFNNILQAIFAYLQVMLAAPPGRPAERSHLLAVEQAAMQARELVEQLLTYSRKVEPFLRPVDLNQVIRETVSFLEHTLPKRITIEASLEPGLPLVSADPNQLKQVLLNLASNARDAMPEGGVLRIATHLDPAPLGENHGHGAVRLTVADTGKGMDQATQAQIFDPFFTTKEPGRGTGLGLSTVYGIAVSHGGSITCQSQPELGTVFRLTLPALAEEARPVAPVREPGLLAPPRPVGVLWVDDEIAILEAGREFLEGAGQRVFTARSGEEALEVYRASGEAVEVVILDVGMPGMGGQQCLGELLALNPRLKVIMTSGYGDGALAKDTLAAGARRFLKKPYPLTSLLKEIVALTAR
ncbi:MAG: PAS domain-containing protein [Deltaproteobacteria bacterium]|nr:PAS domain-containing protein [Deltaproteobacteria bacterium]